VHTDVGSLHHEEYLGTRLSDRGDGALDVLKPLDSDGLAPHAPPGGAGLELLQRRGPDGMRRILEDGPCRRAWHRRLPQCPLLRARVRGHQTDAREVAARRRPARASPRLPRIASMGHPARERGGGLLSGPARGCARCEDDVDLERDEVDRELMAPSLVPLGPSLLAAQLLTLHIAQLRQTLGEGGKERSGRIPQRPDADGLPRGRRAGADRRDETAQGAGDGDEKSAEAACPGSPLRSRPCGEPATRQVLGKELTFCR
jgi:hypothetical protein